MKHLAALLVGLFALSGLPVLASVAAADGVRASVSPSASSCRARKKAKKQDDEGKGKKKGKEEKKPYGFEL